MPVPFGRCPLGSSGRAAARGDASRRPALEPLRAGRVLVVLPEPELVALRVLADGEPAHAWHRQRLAGLAAELGDTRVVSLDVVGAEVDARSATVALCSHDRAALGVRE